jgi:hypothetical protein
MKGAIGVEMSTYWVGMKCDKENIKQCFGDYLQPGVQSVTTGGFPIIEHVIFHCNIGLAKRFTVTCVHFLQGVLANVTQNCEQGHRGRNTQDHLNMPGHNTVRW